MAQDWFRFHALALNNPRVRRLSDKNFRIWVNLMCVVCLEGDASNGKLPSLEDCAMMLHETVDETKVAFHALQTAGLIETVDETFRISKWKEKQYKSDTSTERVRRHRKRLRNVPETAPDTEQNTEQNIPPPTPPRGERVSDFSERERKSYDILAKMTEHGRDRARIEAPRWDLNFLAGEYNQAIRSGKIDPPAIPNLAFPAWCKSRTKGNPP